VYLGDSSPRLETKVWCRITIGVKDHGRLGGVVTVNFHTLQVSPTCGLQMRPLFHNMITQLGFKLGTPRNVKGQALNRRFLGPPCEVEAALWSLAAYQFTGSPGTVAGLRFVWKLIGLGAAASVSVWLTVRNFRRPLAPRNRASR
jgi:hypothetical protein